MSEWISVEDRKPAEFESVLTFSLEKDIENGVRVKDAWFDTLGEIYVSHWMPLPALPEESDE